MIFARAAMLDGADEVDEFAEAVLVDVGAAVVFVECAFAAGVVAFEGDHGVIHVLADAGELGAGLELWPAGVYRHPEDIGGKVFVFVLGIGPGVVAFTGDKLGVVLVESVGDVFEEDETEERPRMQRISRAILTRILLSFSSIAREVKLEFIAVDYNASLKPLEAILSRVRRTGDFYAAGTMELPLPRVEVEGIDPLSFPIPKGQVDALVHHAQRAPYGKGLDTIVDTSVRKVWQIAPDKVRIGGKTWAATFEAILSKVRTGLGCEKVTVSAELYKLLIYDRGGFFLPHRDTEKADGMFGTLVITLPSLHRGGELRLRHAGREVTVDTSAADFSELSYVAFYADCEHEALPVREGNRVCLVYNLVGEPRKSKARKLTAPDNESEIVGIAALLERSLQAPDAAVKIAWLLSHHYSPAALWFSALKGADAARADVLVRAAERAQCAVHLGLVHIGESGAAEPEYADWGNGGRWDRYGDDEDEDDEDEPDEQDADDEDFSVVTVDDGWRFIDHWCDTEDRKAGFGRIPLGEGELLPEGALDDEKPDTQKLTEATGNEGASYERSYHRAALVVWRRDRYADVLLQAGAVACLPYLEQLVAAGSASRATAVAVGGRMIDVWNARSSESFIDDDEQSFASQRIRMLDALGRLGDSALLERFIAAVLTSSHDGSENGALLASLHVLSHERAAALLAELVAARMPKCPNGCAKLLLALSDKPAHRYTSVAEAAVASLDRIRLKIAELPALQWSSLFDETQPPTAEFVEDLLTALQRLGSAALAISAAQRIAARPAVFDPVTIVVPALARIDAARRRKKVAVEAGFTNLWTHAATFLLKRSATTPPPPTDWRQDVRITCSCADCKALQAFARDPVAQVQRFRVRKERRQHLHQAIDKNYLDMTHVTERVGSPQTLVCTKDRRGFKRRMAEYRSDVAAMNALVRIALPLESAEDLSARMQKATASAE